MSARPGMRYLPRPSIRTARRGILSEPDGPTAAIRLFSTSTVWSRRTGSPAVIGSTFTDVKASAGPVAATLAAGAVRAEPAPPAKAKAATTRSDKETTRIIILAGSASIFQGHRLQGPIADGNSDDTISDSGSRRGDDPGACVRTWTGRGRVGSGA